MQRYTQQPVVRLNATQPVRVNGPCFKIQSQPMKRQPATKLKTEFQIGYDMQEENKALKHTLGLLEEELAELRKKLLITIKNSNMKILLRDQLKSNSALRETLNEFKRDLQKEYQENQYLKKIYKASEFHLRKEARNSIFDESRVQVRILNLCAQADLHCDRFDFALMMARLNGRQCILEGYIQNLVGKDWAVPILLELTKVDDQDCAQQQTILIEHLIDALELGILCQTHEIYSLVKRIKPSKSILQRIVSYMEQTEIDLEMLWYVNMNGIQLSKNMYMQLLIQLQTQQQKSEVAIHIYFDFRFPHPIPWTNQVVAYIISSQ